MSGTTELEGSSEGPISYGQFTWSILLQIWEQFSPFKGRDEVYY